MRLTDKEIEIIIDVSKKTFKNPKVWLFGSRVDDNKKGGDIDLYIETDVRIKLIDRIKFITNLQLLIGNRKIDVIFKMPETKYRTIFDTAKKTGFLLC